TAVIEVNELQKRRVVQKLQKHLGRLRGKRVALLGLAFKPNTDDTREAPSLVLASRLLAEGAEVRAWDPIAVPELQGVDLTAVIEVNELQKRRVVQKLQKHLGRLRGKRVALLGLAFKPNTDDTREAPSLVLASRLLAEGAEVRAWDPIAVPELQGVELFDAPLAAVTGADAAVVVTEWPELGGLASEEVRAAMRHPLIIDGRNLLDPGAARAAAFAYEGIGRAVSPLDV